MHSQIIAITAWLDRKLNPVVFKEYALFVRSRVMLGLYCATGLLPLLLVGFTLPLASEWGGAQPGFWVWSYSFGGLLIFGCGGMASLAMRSVVTEREAGTYDLLACSPMTPFQLVWGKWQAVMIFALFGVAAFLPFAAAAYLLGGVDLVVIGLILLGGMMAFSLSAAAGLYSGLVGKTGAGQAARMSVLGVLFAMAGAFLAFLSAGLHHEFMRGSFFGGTTVSVPQFAVGAAASMLTIWSVTIYSTITSAAARITLPPLNPQGLRRRVMFRCTWIVLLYVAVMTAIAPTEPGMIIAMMVVLCIFKLMLTWETAVDAATPGRITRKMALTWRSPLFLPGCAFSYRALFWNLVLFDGMGAVLIFISCNNGTLATWLGMASHSTADEGPFIAFGILTQLSLYILIYTPLAAFIRRRLPVIKPPVVMVLFVAAGSILSSLYLIIFHREDYHTFDPFYLANPVWWLYFMDRTDTLMDGFRMSLFLWLIPAAHFILEWREFTRKKHAVQSLRDGTNDLAMLEV